MDNNLIAKYFQTALLFNIPQSLKRMSFEIRGEKFFVQAVFDRVPEDHEKDCIWAAVAEVLGHFQVEPNTTTNLLVEGSDQGFQDLQCLVFALYESERY